jgi:Family of unknown function (DUF6338)
MIPTFQALGVALLALLPGASYTFAYERIVGGFGQSFSDRLVRFLAASAVMAAVFSAPGLVLYRSFVANGRLTHDGLTWGNLVEFEVAALVYVLLPTIAGSFVGRSVKKNRRWARALVGDAIEPRAWDYLWRSGPEGVVRLKMKSGVWLAGLYGTTESDRRSYAAGYPEEGDLYLAEQLVVDPDDGAFTRDADDRPVPVPGSPGLLVRWEEIEFLDFQEIPRDSI